MSRAFWDVKQLFPLSSEFKCPGHPPRAPPSDLASGQSLRDRIFAARMFSSHEQTPDQHSNHPDHILHRQCIHNCSSKVGLCSRSLETDDPHMRVDGPADASSSDTSHDLALFLLPPQCPIFSYTLTSRRARAP
jgi:hypothetical protein